MGTIPPDVGEISYERVEPYGDELSRYRVFYLGNEVGQVASSRITLWRRTSSGIRTSVYGRPKVWTPVPARDSRITFDTRHEAAYRMAEYHLEGGEG